MNIYLAGKIGTNDEITYLNEDWRYSIVDRRLISDGANGPLVEDYWPIQQAAILNTHDYTGPFFQEDKHGWLGEAHGSYECRRTSTLCKRAIDLSDVIFAWIDAPDAYGRPFNENDLNNTPHFSIVRV